MLLAVQSTPNPPTVPTIWIPTQMFLAEKDGSLLILQRESGFRSAVKNLSFGAGLSFREVDIRICGLKKQDSSLLSMARYGRRSMEGKRLVLIKTKTEVRINFKEVVRVRAIRIYPHSWNQEIALRI